MKNNFDYLIVGAGFAGSVAAERLSSHGKSVLLIDRRDHIGGNAHDKKDDNGLLIHPYGPHLFHTNSKRIFEYLSKFTNWRFYEHRVLAEVDGNLYPIPINRTTINKLYNLNLDEEQIADYLENVRLKKDKITSSEDVVLNSVGEDLCTKFFRGYTKKQWGVDLDQLSPGVAARIPTRTNDDDRYFTDTYQFMPADGYTAMFKNMLASNLIETRLGVDFNDIKDSIKYEHLIYTGPIDEYFGYCFGKLPYRSLKFSHEHIPGKESIQPVGTVNYPNTHDYTRITEFKHITGQLHTGTSIVKEIPCSTGEPYYPIPQTENEALYRKYRELSSKNKNVSFIGRLAQYKYYNMDQVVAAAIACVESLINE